MHKFGGALSKSIGLGMRFNVIQRKKYSICRLWKSGEVRSLFFAGAFRSLSKSVDCIQSFHAVSLVIPLHTILLEIVRREQWHQSSQCDLAIFGVSLSGALDDE